MEQNKELKEFQGTCRMRRHGMSPERLTHVINIDYTKLEQRVLAQLEAKSGVLNKFHEDSKAYLKPTE